MEKLKYTTYDISQLVRKEISNYGGIEDISRIFNIPKDTLNYFYSNLDYFDLELYQIASKILDKSIQELTSIEHINEDELKTNIKKRESVNKNSTFNYENLNTDIDNSIAIFSMIIDSYKLKGDLI